MLQHGVRCKPIPGRRMHGRQRWLRLQHVPSRIKAQHWQCRARLLLRVHSGHCRLRRIVLRLHRRPNVCCRRRPGRVHSCCNVRRGHAANLPAKHHAEPPVCSVRERRRVARRGQPEGMQACDLVHAWHVRGSRGHEHCRLSLHSLPGGYVLVRPGSKGVHRAPGTLHGRFVDGRTAILVERPDLRRARHLRARHARNPETHRQL